MNKSKRRELILLVLPVLILLGLSVFFFKRPVPVDDSKIEAKLEKVVLLSFVKRGQKFLKISVAVKYRGPKPSWWGQIPATITFEQISVIASNGLQTYKSESAGPANFEAKSGLFRRNCDIPIYKQDGPLVGGKLKFFVRVNGNGYRPNDPNYERVHLGGRESFAMDIK